MGCGVSSEVSVELGVSNGSGIPFISFNSFN
jgi:hypothetical protein